MQVSGAMVKNDDEAPDGVGATVEFARDRLIVGAILPDGETLEVRFGDRIYSGVAAAGRADVAIPYDDIYAMKVLDPKIWIDGGDRREVSLPLLLHQIDIRTSAQFSERVQSLRKRMTDNEAVRFAARRLLMDRDSKFDDAAAAVCAIGYRIVEGRDPADSDIAFLKAAAQDLLALATRNERYARWVTSVTMVLAYLAILLRDAAEAERQLVETLSYRPFLPQLSLLHTNFSRSNLLLALIRAARNDVVGARAALDDIDQVFRTGVRSSWIDHDIRGRSQYSEVIAVMKVARLAEELGAELREAVTQDRLAAFAASASLTAISPIVKALQSDGHWQAILDHNSRSKVAASNRTRWEKPVPEDVVSHSAGSIAPADQLSHAFAAWKASDVRSLFAEFALDFRNQAVAAIREGNVVLPEAFGLIDELFAIEPELRRRIMLDWPTLTRLAGGRLLTACLLSTTDRDTAYDMLRQQTRWCKQVVATFPFATLDDYDEAAQFVFTGLLSYLVANRYLEPRDRHIADHGIPEDFARTFRRVFKDEPLQVCVIDLIEKLSR